MHFNQHCFIDRPSLCRRMLGSNPHIIATLALTVRRSNPSARSNPNTAISYPFSPGIIMLSTDKKIIHLTIHEC